jgi:hypothetical protein
MRQAKYAWLLFALALAAIAVPIAQGTSSAKDPRVPALAKKVAALQASVATLQTNLATLQKTADALTTKSNCIGVQPIVLRGQGADEGYLYKKTGDATNVYLLTAFDATAQGETPGALMGIVNPSCVTGSRSLYRSLGRLTSRSAPYNR